MKWEREQGERGVKGWASPAHTHTHTHTHSVLSGRKTVCPHLLLFVLNSSGESLTSSPTFPSWLPRHVFLLSVTPFSPFFSSLRGENMMSYFDHGKIQVVMIHVTFREDEERWTKKQRHKHCVCVLKWAANQTACQLVELADPHQDSLCLKLNLYRLIYPWRKLYSWGIRGKYFKDQITKSCWRKCWWMLNKKCPEMFFFNAAMKNQIPEKNSGRKCQIFVEEFIWFLMLVTAACWWLSFIVGSPLCVLICSRKSVGGAEVMSPEYTGLRCLQPDLQNNLWVWSCLCVFLFHVHRLWTGLWHVVRPESDRDEGHLVAGL